MDEYYSVVPRRGADAGLEIRVTRGNSKAPMHNNPVHIQFTFVLSKPKLTQTEAKKKKIISDGEIKLSA